MSPVLQNDIFGKNKERAAIERLMMFCPPEGYFVAFSGGKDSSVVKHLCDQAGVKYDAHYAMTTVDPPELVRFIRKTHPDVGITRPGKPFFRELESRGFPTRWHRWCCEYLKEAASRNRVTVTGVRRDESIRRSQREIVEISQRTGARLVNPIVDWTLDDVWRYIRGYNVPYCGLYDEGWKRLGCVLCPMTSPAFALQEAARWPRLAALWRRAFDQLYAYRKAKGLPSVDQWASGAEMFAWWMTVGHAGNPNRQPDCQGALFN